jgi:7,8-dihydropterin-6-yl-methyl-4-(beta-D-ribofuranosyl)aminobenzene 5'-phosphate synthase
MPGSLPRADRDVVLGDEEGIMQPVDRLTVHVVVDNTTDMLSSRPKHIASELRVLRDAGMTELAGEALCSAHHGLCLAVSAHRDGETRTVLIDPMTPIIG